MILASLQGAPRVVPLVLLLSTGCLSTLVAGYEDGGTHSSSSTAGGSSGSSNGTVGTSSGQGSSWGAGTSSGATGSGTGGGTSTGGTSSGGSTTGPELCLGVYCAPAFVCDPTDGICKCDGQECSGNCEADSGACVAACDADGGSYPVIGQSPMAIQMTTARLDQIYYYALQSACGVQPVFWQLLSNQQQFESSGLNFYPQGNISGVPEVASDGGPFEFEIEATDAAGNTGVQNYLLDVVAGP